MCERYRVESPGAYEFHAAIIAWPCVLLDCPPVLWWLSPEEGWDVIHDAVEINCKNGATAEYQGTGVKYMAKGCVC